MIIKVEMGDGAVSKSPDIIISQGIGSCVVLTLYNAKTKIGGMAHIMMPEKIKNSKYRIQKGNILASGFLDCQFADTAVPALLKEMRKEVLSGQDIYAKIIGGARMFSSYADIKSCIGEENITSIKQILQKHKIPIAGFDVGGSHGRNIEFHLESGRVVVKAFGKEDKEI